MRPIESLSAYGAHPDPATAACNRIALLVAGNQPLYPLYLWWIVGGDWPTSCWTFLSTPLFASVPAVSRRHKLAGRALLPLAGLFNGIVSAKAFGEASGVELFLIACALITLLACRDAPRWMIALLAAIGATALLHGHYGTPLGAFTPDQYARFWRLNAYSVAALSVFVLWSLFPLRVAAARRSGGRGTSLLQALPPKTSQDFDFDPPTLGQVSKPADLD